MRKYLKREIRSVLQKVRDEGLSGAIMQLENLLKNMGGKNTITDEDVPQGAKDILDSYLQ